MVFGRRQTQTKLMKIVSELLVAAPTKKKKKKKKKRFRVEKLPPPPPPPHSVCCLFNVVGWFGWVFFFSKLKKFSFVFFSPPLF